MAKPTKKKPKTTKKDQISTNDQLATQNQPAPYKKETITKEKKTSKLLIFSWCLLFAFCILMYNSVMDQYMTSYALKSALSHEYVYSNYVEKKMSPLDVVFSTVFYCILFSYVLVIWALSDSCSHHHSSSGGRGPRFLENIIAAWMAFPFISIIPIIFFCLIHHHNVDRFMYKNIKNLYQIVSQDPKFNQNSMNASFQKAIREKDYDTLKELSNNINALAKVTPEQLNTLEDAVSKLPLYKIRSDFETFKDGYNSYEEYTVFYKKAKKLFNASEYKNSPKYMEEMKNLKIIGYDYEPIKTIID